jgi:hypothetical protein
LELGKKGKNVCLNSISKGKSISELHKRYMSFSDIEGTICKSKAQIERSEDGTIKEEEQTVFKRHSGP